MILKSKSESITHLLQAQKKPSYLEGKGSVDKPKCSPCANRCRNYSTFPSSTPTHLGRNSLRLINTGLPNSECALLPFEASSQEQWTPRYQPSVSTSHIKTTSNKTDNPTRFSEPQSGLIEVGEVGPSFWTAYQTLFLARVFSYK